MFKDDSFNEKRQMLISGEITIDTYLKYIRKMYAFDNKVISYHERDPEIDLKISLEDYESNSDSDSEPSASANSPHSAT